MILIDVHKSYRKSYLGFNTAERKNTIIVQNYCLSSAEEYFKCTHTKYFSLGLHPWNVKTKEDVDLKVKTLIDFIKENTNKPLFIGETGLDLTNKHKENFNIQKLSFLKHIKVAKANSIPLLLHCVKAYNQVIQILKNENYNGVIIIHDFNGNKEIINQFLELKKFNIKVFFSLGSNSLKTNSKIARNLSILPLENILFETDESIEPIDSIYKNYTQHSLIESKQILKQVYENFKSLL